MRRLTRLAALAGVLAIAAALFLAAPAFAVAPPAFGSVTLKAVQFVDAQHGFAAGGFFTDGKGYGFIERTDNGGTTWTRGVVAGAGYVTSISFPTNGTVGYAADRYSPDKIFKTVDSGATWNVVNVNTGPGDANKTIESVWFTSDLAGYASGRDSILRPSVWRTTDGGITWKTDPEFPAFKTPAVYDDESGYPLNSGAFREVTGYDDTRPIAVGSDFGAALSYRSDGASWMPDSLPAMVELKAVSYPAANTALAVGPTGKAAVLSAAGWSAAPSGVIVNLEDVDLFDATHGWAVGYNGVILFWNGTSFVPQTSGTSAYLGGVSFTSATNGWAVGDEEKLLHTTDGGAHWLGVAPDDAVAPTTSIALPAATNGWYRSDVAFTLTANDNAGGTGVAATYYTLNGGGQLTYGTSPVTVSAEGVTTVAYHSVDGKGNSEAPKTATISIDKTAPVSTASVASGKVTIAATDARSGVDRIAYDVDGGTAQTYVAPFAVPAGTHAVHYYAIDKAGNAEAAKTISATGTGTSNTVVEPIAGADRYATAIAAVEKAFPAGAQTVVIAYGRNFPDALGAAALCGAHASPLLLTETGYIPTAVRAEITKLGAKKAIIIGSESVVSKAVADDLARLTGSTPERVAGADRYATAAQVAGKVPAAAGATTADDVFLAVGENFPDALAASPAAYAKRWPILLTRKDSLPASTLAALQGLKPKRIHVLGSAAAVSDAVLGQLPAGITIDRWAGGTRYATAVDIATKSGLSFDGVALATGENFPDALAGGVMQGRLGSVVLLTQTSVLSADTKTALTAHKTQIHTVRYLGSTNAVSQAVRNAVTAALK